MARAESSVEIVNRRGLHARASAALARLAGACRGSVQVAKDGHSVTATSIMGLMMLGAAKGDHVTVTVEAEEDMAMQILDEICTFIADRFGESE